MITDDEVGKYKKKADSNISKSKAKSKHKHIQVLFDYWKFR